MFAPGAMARRLTLRPWPGCTRRAVKGLRPVLTALALVVAAAAQATPSDVVVAAEFTEPTTRYDHAILGDNVEWRALMLTIDPCLGCAGSRPREVITRLPDSRVFEDLEPRIIEGDDGPSLVMVVETDLSLGARLALYDGSGLYAAEPPLSPALRASKTIAATSTKVGSFRASSANSTSLMRSRSEIGSLPSVIAACHLSRAARASASDTSAKLPNPYLGDGQRWNSGNSTGHRRLFFQRLPSPVLIDA